MRCPIGDCHGQLNQYMHVICKMNKNPIISSSPPLTFKLAKWFQKKGIRGGYRLENIIHSLGWLNVKVRYALMNKVALDIPIWYRPYDLSFIYNYEYRSIEFITKIVRRINKPFLLIDCGADIGIISARLVSECRQIENVYCFEPNITSFEFLDNNLKLLPVKTVARNQAISDFSGKGVLHKPDFDSSDHAAFIVPDNNGSIDVTTIDELQISENENILIKIDVEGGELDVLHGASATLLNAKKFVIVFEAHYLQVKRVGVDPVDIISHVGTLGQVKAVVVEKQDVEINLNIPFFDQFPDGIYNICIYTI